MSDFVPVYWQVLVYLFTFLVGTYFGSAFNCLAYRMAREQKWSKGRSVCVHCAHTLSVLDLIPVFSFLFLKGRCRYCGKKLSPRYLVSELILGAAFLSVLLRFGFTLDSLSGLVLVSCLFCLSLVDLDIQIIPDRFLLIPALVRLAQLLWQSGWKQTLLALIPALVFGGGLLILSLVMDKILQKDTMGGGDIKLLAVLGLFFTFAQCLFLLVVACVAGILIAAALKKARPDTAFPFGPALSLAAWLTLLAGQPLVNWYMSLF